jgi:dihydroflavonol-4-reductase
MLAFVTGSTGFVGSHVARALAQQGADLRLLVRANSNTKNINEVKGDLVTGDPRDPPWLGNGIAGCDVVFHVGRVARLNSLDWTLC